MRIKWSIGDGYVNRKPDFKFEIPDEELEGMTETEISLHIDQCVEDEFHSRCSLDWEIDK